VTTTSIPLGDAWALRRLRIRTQAIRLALAAAVLASAIAAIFVANSPAARSVPLLPPVSDGVLVLDLSASSSAPEYDRMYSVLTGLARSHARFGLVIFSDRAYEALPPGTPASALLTVSRYFRGPPYPTNPWAAGFSLGTVISQGLDLARSLLLAYGVHRRDVWLISDLGDASQDRPLVAKSIRAYRDSGIALHLLPLDPLKTDLAFFTQLLGGPSPSVLPRPLPAVRTAAGDRYAFPLALVVLAGVLALALALNELVGAPLRWGRSQPIVPELAR
jgi:hypothetical protein